MIFVLCDLCGQPSQGRTHDGDEFELEGRICGGCCEELRDERRLERYHQLAKVKVPIAKNGASHASGRANGWLAVLTPGFTTNDLTTRAACRLMVVEAKRRSA